VNIQITDMSINFTYINLGWLEPVNTKADKAYCKVCKKELAAVVTALKKHCKMQYHIGRISELNDPSLVRIDSILVYHTTISNAHDAELRMAAFITEHDLPFHLMDYFSDLLPVLCPDCTSSARGQK